eukprot:scaffold317966_cov26-Prasinocladus_malaysianus.AAC.1
MLILSSYAHAMLDLTTAMRPESNPRRQNDSVVLRHRLHMYTDRSAACCDCMHSDKRSKTSWRHHPKKDHNNRVHRCIKKADLARCIAGNISMPAIHAWVKQCQPETARHYA